MKTQRFTDRAMRKCFLVLLLAILAFQTFGINGLAAPANVSRRYQETSTYPLTCGVSPNLSYCDIKIVLMIDDSGSMRKNDPRIKDSLGNDIGGIRNQGAVNLVDLLAKQYYLPALESK
ncbi:MAG: hypothetical protein ACM3XO_21845, partial [Bacteroidota bacterium]